MALAEQQSPFDWRAIHNALNDWFCISTGLPTVWANQDLTQIPYPFATLQMIAGPIPQSAFDDVRTESKVAGTIELMETHTGNIYGVTISCNVFVGKPDNSNPDANSLHYMGKAKAALGVSDFIKMLSEAGIGLVGALGMQNLDFFQDDTWVSRTQMDAQFSIAGSVTEQTTEFIESTDLEATIKNAVGVDVDDALLIQNVT